MSTGERILLRAAQEVSKTLLDVLMYAGRVDVAGSIRRKKADVGDIELVIDARDNAVAPEFATIDGRIDALLSAGKISQQLRPDGKARAWGTRYKAGVFQGVNVDFWLVRDDRNYDTTLLIRTGPGDGNKWLVTSEAYGGGLPDHVRFHEGNLWRCFYPSHSNNMAASLPPGSIPVINAPEQFLFDLLRMAYVPPEERSVAAYRDAKAAWQPAHIEARGKSLTLTLTLATARIDTHDPARKDITVDAVEKKRASLETLLLAPSQMMVNEYKRRGGDQEAEAAYTKQYLDLVRWRYAAYKQQFISLLDTGRMVLTCFCAPGEFCHRHLALDVLTKIGRRHGVEVIEEGEILSGTGTDAPNQLTLFEEGLAVRNE